MKKKQKSEPTLIGYWERVSFPELEIEDIKAKIDTGAYSTALHCHEIWVEKNEGIKELCFDILDPDHPMYNEKIFRFSDFELKKVKSSNGQNEKRYLIKITIVLGSKKFKTDVTLTDRGNMRYPVLIGRKLLRRGFLIDVSKKNVANT